MNKLKVKLLDHRATAPTVGHAGEDLGYDLYAIQDTVLMPGVVTKVETGVAASAYTTTLSGKTFGMGLLYRDRSSMAEKGIIVVGGVIDAGYTGELKVMLLNLSGVAYKIGAGDRIVQMLPQMVLTGETEVVDELAESSRGAGGFGSTGR